MELNVLEKFRRKFHNQNADIRKLHRALNDNQRKENMIA